MRTSQWLAATAVMLSGAGVSIVACSSDNASTANCATGTSAADGACSPTMDGSTDVGTGDDGSVEASVEAGGPPRPANRCPFVHGEAMVELPKPGLTYGTYCIDSSEATNAQFREFELATQNNYPDPSSDSMCGNRYDSPDPTNRYCRYDWVNLPNNPVACVSWCAAAAYCSWAGKRLCGGFGGGALDPSAAADSDKGEWTRACSSAGRYAYTTGDDLPLDCNDVSVADAGSIPVGSDTKCHPPTAPWSGVFDMTGNVAEWENACDGGACNLRGGSFYENILDGQCSHAAFTLIDRHDYYIGFRCCAD